MYSQENKSADLAKLLGNYDVVLMDTCSLMEDSFPGFMDLLVQNDYWEGQVVVLKQCVKELQKHAKSKDSSKKVCAKRALKIIRHAESRAGNRKIRIEKKVKSKRDFADKVLFNLVNDLRTDKKVLLITQDKKLAYDIRSLNHLGSQHGRDVDVDKIRPDSSLEPNYGEDENGYRPPMPKTQQPRPRGRFSLFHRRDQEERPSLDKEPIFLEDRRLTSNLPNGNYPLARKLEDVDAQIARLTALPPEKLERLSLSFTLDQLRQEKARLLKGENAKPLVSKPKEAPKAAPSLKVEKKPLPEIKPVSNEKKDILQPKKEEKPVLVKQKKQEIVPHSYYEKGRNASFALNRLGEHYGWLFRDPSIPYVPMIHGEYDLTSDALKEIDEVAKDLPVGEEKDLSFGALKIHLRHGEESFFVSKAAEPKPLPKKTEEAPKPEEKPVQKEETPVVVAKPQEEKPSEPSIEKTEVTSPEAPKKEPVREAQEEAPKAKPAEDNKPAPKKRGRKPKKAESEETPKAVTPEPSVSAEKGLAAVPSGVTIYVGEPGAHSRFSRRPLTEQHIATKESAKASQPQPSKRGRKPKAESSSKPLSKKEAPKKAEAKPASAKQKATKPVALEAPKETKGKRGRPSIPSDHFEEALKADKKLNANINNPTYPDEHKIRDIKNQIGLVRSLKQSESKKLLLGLRELERRLKELQGKKK